MQDLLASHKYINLTTFRRSGAPVTTTVWFAQDDGRLYVTTTGQSGKAKRLRNNGDVRIAPSTATGSPLGEEFKATARILPAAELATAARNLRQKYGWALRLFQFLGRVRGQEHVYLEIMPASPVSVKDVSVRKEEGSYEQ